MVGQSTFSLASSSCNQIFGTCIPGGQSGGQSEYHCFAGLDSTIWLALRVHGLEVV